MFVRLLLWPGDWIAAKTTTRARRSVAAWILIFTVVPGVPAWYVLRDALWFVGLLSIVALVLAMWGVVSAETPVEEE